MTLYIWHLWVFIIYIYIYIYIYIHIYIHIYTHIYIYIYSFFFFKIDNESAIAMAMVWRRINDRPLPKARLSHFTDAPMRHYASRMSIIYL